MIDRDKQRRNSGMDDFTGIQGIHLQDQTITELEGLLYDRSAEHLASSDMMVIRVRRRLLMAAHALAEQGLTPTRRRRSGGLCRTSGRNLLARGCRLARSDGALPTWICETSGAGSKHYRSTGVAQVEPRGQRDDLARRARHPDG
jgi:hypothetical protein